MRKKKAKTSPATDEVETICVELDKDYWPGTGATKQNIREVLHGGAEAVANLIQERNEAHTSEIRYSRMFWNRELVEVDTSGQEVVMAHTHTHRADGWDIGADGMLMLTFGARQVATYPAGEWKAVRRIDIPEEAQEGEAK